MWDFDIDQKFLGHTPPMGSASGWLYEFFVRFAGRHFSVPIVISDACPEAEREDAAKREFQGWVDNLVQEAATL